ncbi:hypothetical protein I5M32_11570 [Pedobacter sp. SD-b]|uniref:Polysaccharide lyase n=1 Tax=Pedobacter segetis TaxID=2793069 RepID=A0ABS1BL68_9SPHI|nr:hypothetical protein [Pedobacter segetis]MBK0383596.1 hypothetical protein [Pedobacter segetis]
MDFRNTSKLMLMAIFVAGIFHACKKSKSTNPQEVIPTPTIPTVQTLETLNITTSTATAQGKVTASGGKNISESGFCWDTLANPTIIKSHLMASSNDDAGGFSKTLENLKSDKKYYLRAYAKNEVGIAYGNEVTFSTKQEQGSTDDTSSIVATQIWYGDPNKPWRDVFTNFNTEDNGGTTPTLTPITDPTYGKVWEVFKPAGAKRAEISRIKDYSPTNGEVIYISYKWKINIRQKDATNGFAVFQWKTEDGNKGPDRQNYPFNLAYNAGSGNLTLNAYGPGTPDWTEGSSINNRKNTLWNKVVPQDQWQSIIIGIKISDYVGTDTTQLGYIEYWFNGVKQPFEITGAGKDYRVILSADKKRAYHRTLDGNTTYPKWGAYGEGARNYDVTAYVADLRLRRK